jgi:mannose-6-phosphate isomerase-like protein (cupin superfamily)
MDKIKKSGSYFHTFINKDSLAAGILMLKPGEEDTQEPHESDEVYFIISGNGFLKIKNKDYEILKDKLFFVGKGVPHYFHSNTNELKVLYFFGGSDT